MKFNDIEGLKIGIELERRGNSFYTRAAQITRDDDLRTLLTALARDEAEHEEKFKKMLDIAEARYEHSGNSQLNYNEETSIYLSAVASDILFPDSVIFASAHGVFDSPLNIIKYAMQSEKDAILFYEGLAQATEDDDSKEVFVALAKEEMRHLMYLQKRFDKFAKAEVK